MTTEDISGIYSEGTINGPMNKNEAFPVPLTRAQKYIGWKMKQHKSGKENRVGKFATNGYLIDGVIYNRSKISATGDIEMLDESTDRRIGRTMFQQGQLPAGQSIVIAAIGIKWGVSDTDVLPEKVIYGSSLVNTDLGVQIPLGILNGEVEFSVDNAIWARMPVREFIETAVAQGRDKIVIPLETMQEVAHGQINKISFKVAKEATDTSGKYYYLETTWYGPLTMQGKKA